MNLASCPHEVQVPPILREWSGGLGSGRAGEWDSRDLSGEAAVTLVPGFQRLPLES